jgi:3-phenylpropionate/cinnamic acid dioxygenase small subunit
VGAIDLAAGRLPLRLAQLNADYARALDDDRMEEWPDFFTDPCLYVITTADNHRHGYTAGIVYADSQGMLHDRVAALREANVYERQAYRHVVGLPAVRGKADGLVRVETAFLVVRIMRDGRMDLFATGRYLDALVDEGGTLRFRERVVVCDNNRFDTLLAIPL